MKTLKHWLLSGIAAAFCCSIANAQVSYTNTLAGATLIYSNAFNGGAVNISNTPPNYAVTLFGGSNNAVWIDAGTPGDTNAFYANGTVGTGQGDTILLPFKAQSNQVYTLTATVNINGNPGNWVTCGYAQNYSMPGIANSAPNGGGLNSYAWTLRNFSGNTEYFAGAGGGNNVYNNTPAGPVNSGTYTYVQIMNSTSNRWITTAFFDGVPLGSPYTYPSAPSIGAIGLGQHALPTPNEYQWTSLTLFANQLAILQQPVSANVNQGANFTAAVLMGGTPPFSYQWFTNGVPLVNGGAISGATNGILTIGSVLPGNAATNYYCVITNVYGAVTSSPASLGVYTVPQFLSADPVTYTNLMTLFGGTNIDGTNYLGSSPTFSVVAAGLQPVTYFWLTNGVAVGGASSSAFTFTNCQLGGPASFTCIASNSLGTATNTWAAQYIPTPTAPYPQTVIADSPVAYWRLDETNYDADQFNDGEVCNDFMSGNNGIYTNTVLYQPGYYVTNNGVTITNDPTETSAQFTSQDYFTGDYVYGLGTNVDFSGSSNAEFTVSIWANGGDGYATGEPVNSGMMVKGYYGTEEFALDDGASGGDVRFMVRSAANTIYAASSTLQLGGSNTWFHLVGVCDESNGVIALYINGLRAAQTAIPRGSGLLPDAGLPISFGENLSPGNLDSGHQFYGALDDAAVFNYALNAGQVAQLFGAAGGSTALTVFPPPTNIAYIAGSTLTIPVTAFGSPPIGYYWTNLTTASVIASGSTNVLQTLNATLTISNAPPTLSGDQLELVITNATASTNLFVTLFNPPLPITLSYSNSILFTNEFYGGTWTIAGQPLTAENTLVGGTNTAWIDVQGTNDTGSLEANGVDNCTLGNSWIVPFTPHPGYVYTETASVTFNGNPGNWIGMGYAQNLVRNTTAARFDDAGPAGLDWILLQVNNDNMQYFTGTSTQVSNQNNFFASGAVPHMVQVVLDTTGPQWVQSASIDGVSAGTNTYTSTPTVAAAGITQNGPMGSPNDVKWSYWSLTQVAPGGVPPYLLNPLPPSSVSLTNSTVSIAATAFGSGPFGYTWTFNNSVLESGTTNNMAPLSANLSVPSSSLSGGQLQLTVTNAYGTNVTLVTVVSPVNPNPPKMGITVSNNIVYVTWPVDHTGWQLQAQTNNLSVGISTNWVNVSGSATTNQVVFPINANDAVFYRLLYTP